MIKQNNEVQESSISTTTAMEISEEPSENVRINRICSSISHDVTKLYLGTPCNDQDSVLSLDIGTRRKERPIELVNYLRQLCNLDHNPSFQLSSHFSNSGIIQLPK